MKALQLKTFDVFVTINRGQARHIIAQGRTMEEALGKLQLDPDEKIIAINAREGVVDPRTL